MALDDQVEQEMEQVWDGSLTLLTGRNYPTLAEGDPHVRITQAEEAVIALQRGIMLLAQRIRDLESNPRR